MAGASLRTFKKVYGLWLDITDGNADHQHVISAMLSYRGNFMVGLFRNPGEPPSVMRTNNAITAHLDDTTPERTNVSFNALRVLFEGMLGTGSNNVEAICLSRVNGNIHITIWTNPETQPIAVLTQVYVCLANHQKLRLALNDGPVDGMNPEFHWVSKLMEASRYDRHWNRKWNRLRMHQWIPSSC